MQDIYTTETDEEINELNDMSLYRDVARSERLFDTYHRHPWFKIHRERHVMCMIMCLNTYLQMSYLCIWQVNCANEFEKSFKVCNNYFRGKMRCILNTMAKVKYREYRLHM